MTLISGAADTVRTVKADRMILEISFIKAESTKQKGGGKTCERWCPSVWLWRLQRSLDGDSKLM